MLLTLYQDRPSSAATAETFKKENIIEKLKALDSRARRKGLDSLDPAKNILIELGTEVDGEGHVTKNSYGIFNLSWQAERHPEWPAAIVAELDEIKKGIRETHGAPLKFLIWAGMGGSAEDKSMYEAAGLLKRGPKVYVLDSTDPAKLKSILLDMVNRSKLTLPDALKCTLVVGMALGMTSYEPVVNLQKLAQLYAKYKVDAQKNFVYMTLPDSLLDQFGKQEGYRKIELQLDNGNSTSGRHSAPMTRGSLYPLGLAGVDLKAWMESTFLSEKEIFTAWELSAFLNTQCAAGRDKITLMMPKGWQGASLWTKQNFEESLGKREDFGIKVVIDEKLKLANFLAPKQDHQDRAFLAIQIKGVAHPDAQKIATLRRSGYPVAVVTFTTAELSRYMQFIHYTVFGIGYLQNMNFVTQPGVELYKAITGRLQKAAEAAGNVERTAEWQAALASPKRARWRNSVTLHYPLLPEAIAVEGNDAASVYAGILRTLTADRTIEYGELTFFGDTRYFAPGKSMRKTLDRGAEGVFHTALKMPADVYEGPAMNHSYHEMIIGHGRCLSTVILSEKSERLPECGYTAEYHKAQFLATQMALAERGRYVVAITVKDLEDSTLATLDEFFRQVATHLKGRHGR